MNWYKEKISNVKNNPNNPRVIKDDKFEKLVRSIKEFPKMLEIRPIVVNDDMIVLGGNMRLKACKEAGLKEVPIIKASDLTEDEQRQFIIKDNVSGGEWDWEQLASEWDAEKLDEWGLDVPEFTADVDYSILDDEDVEDQLNDMTNGVKKAIQIEFEAEHYEEAYELVKFWREKGGYVGGMIMEFLKAEKEKI
jgi:ParB-like chromosome segregation protein Spo0J